MTKIKIICAKYAWKKGYEVTIYENGVQKRIIKDVIVEIHS